MSMISELICNLRKMASKQGGCSGEIMKLAADTIEELSAKVARQNMERSSQYYGGGWISVNDCLPPQPEENKALDYKPLELYLVYVKGDDYPFRAFWNGKFFSDGITKVQNVAYWIPMPLPSKYEPKNREDDETPECFIPEENNPYPLCVGNGNKDCENCCLYVDYPEPPFD